MHSVKRPEKIVAKIGPSILNADLSNLHEECKKLVDNGADYLHLDVMDGHFVPNITFGTPVIQCLTRKMKAVFYETHMMVSNPEQWIGEMAEADVDQYTFHVEASKNPKAICRKIREFGMKCGIALNPSTSIEAVIDYVDYADVILVMTVDPGFGGQKFIQDMMPKVQWLRKNYPTLDIEVDGGVGPNTITACAEAGANFIVSGTAIVKSKDQKETMDSMRSIVDSHIVRMSLERMSLMKQ